MPSTRKKHRSSKRGMRGGKAERYTAEELDDVARYVKHNYNKIENILDELTPVFRGKPDEWFVEHDISDLKKKSDDIVKDLDDLSLKIKDTEHYKRFMRR